MRSPSKPPSTTPQSGRLSSRPALVSETKRVCSSKVANQVAQNMYTGGAEELLAASANHCRAGEERSPRGRRLFPGRLATGGGEKGMPLASLPLAGSTREPAAGERPVPRPGIPAYDNPGATTHLSQEFGTSPIRPPGVQVPFRRPPCQP